MNKRSHIHKKADSSASNPVLSQLQSRPFIAQAKPQLQKPLTQTEIKNQEFQQQKFEATRLKLQAKHDTITPEGQEQLTVLQAKMSDLLHSRLEHASRFERNFANIPISRPDASSQQALQTKLMIGEPGDKYEQEADRIASQVVNQINAPVSQQVGQNLQREEMSVEEKELQMKPILQLRLAQVGQRAVQLDKSNIVLYRRPLYRGMIDDGGKPQIGDSARKLGVRQEEITVEQRDGENFIIAKDNEGMSTAPDTPRNLPEHRRNKDWGGKGKDPVWEIDDSKVTGALKAFQDKPTHVTVAASHDMPLEDFKAALSNTQNNWNKTLPPS